MPWAIKRFPRLSGLGLLGLGWWCAEALSRLRREGGLFLAALPAMTVVCLLLGGYLAVLGRPVDAEGYSPDWWNLGYVGVLGAAVALGLLVSAAFL